MIERTDRHTVSGPSGAPACRRRRRPSLAAAAVACVLSATALTSASDRTVEPGEASDDARARVGTFAAVDVVIDPGPDASLAAYQVEVTPLNAGVTLAGVEGGASDSAFVAPPHYDPVALAGREAEADGPLVKIAAFTLDEELRAGRVRVARLHFWLPADSASEPLDNVIVGRLAASAGPDGDRLEAASLRLIDARTAAGGSDESEQDQRPSDDEGAPMSEDAMNEGATR